MDIGKKVINGYIWMWMALFLSGVVIMLIFFLYDCLKILMGYPGIIRGH